MTWWGGFELAFGLMGAIFLHEIGHWSYLRVNGISARIIVTPLIGLTIGETDQEGDIPLSPHQHGMLLLSGALWSIAPVYLLLLTGLDRYEPIIYLCVILPIINLLNLLIWLPITDGGRLILLLVGNRRGRHVATWAALIGGGALLPYISDWWWTAGLVALSLWLRPVLSEVYARAAYQLCRKNSWRLGFIFLATISLNLAAIWWCVGEIVWINFLIY